jgi:hypothetical protein
MPNPKAFALPVDVNGETGLDILLADPSATIEDYLAAVDSFVADVSVGRHRNQGSTGCYGCFACCQERIPLTSIDFNRLFTYHLDFAGELSWRRFLNKISLISVEGRQVDITLRLDQEGFCIFLNQKEGLCNIYPIRPLVCRTYICLPLAKNALDLRELVVNLGEDELVRLWLADAVGEIPAYHEGDQPELHIEDWVLNPFSGKKDYQDVFLKDLCPPELWARLFS